MKKELVIFDMDGTLVNSSLAIANAINHVRQNLGFEPMEQSHILKHVNDPTINPAKFFYHAKQFDADHERWFSEYHTKNHKSELVLYEGIRELLVDLKSTGHKIAIATNAYRQSALESLDHLGVRELFDAIGCYDDVTHAKPEPDMLYKVLETLECSVDDALFIGDGPRDQMAAKHAKMDYIMVDWGFTDHHNATRSVEALRQILGV